MHKVFRNLRKLLLHYIGHKFVMHKIFIINVITKTWLRLKVVYKEFERSWIKSIINSRNKISEFSITEEDCMPAFMSKEICTAPEWSFAGNRNKSAFVCLYVYSVWYDPVESNPADYDTINNMKENAGNLRLGLFVDEANPETLKLYGFEEPTAILEFHTVAGKTGATGASGVFDVSSWDEQLTTLTVGGKKGEMSSYILYEGNIYSISDFTMSSFLKTDPIKSVARYVVLTPLTSLEEVLVEQKGEEPVLYSLVVEEIPATEDEAAEEKYHCLKNGEEIPFETFAAAWQRLMTVTVSGRFSTNYEPGEAYIKYTFRTVNKRTHTVELSDLDEMHDAVTLDGHTRFYLIKGGMTELP